MQNILNLKLSEQDKHSKIVYQVKNKISQKKKKSYFFQCLFNGSITFKKNKFIFRQISIQKFEPNHIKFNNEIIWYDNSNWCDKVLIRNCKKYGINIYGSEQLFYFIKVMKLF